VLIIANSLPDGVVLQCDVAVVGSGPAGLSVADELANCHRRVIVLEAGAITQRRGDRRVLRGECSGVPFPIAASRDIGFGGTSRLWQRGTAMRARRLDPIDFEPLPIRAGIAWPFGADELEPFYQRASHRLGIACARRDVGWLSASEQATAPSICDGPQLAGFQFAQHQVFRGRLDELTASPWIEVVSEAVVRTVDVCPESGRVRGLDVISSSGSRVRIEARRYVLAGGAIENARLLLDSPGRTGRGLGNEHDQVGRWFMEHLCVDTGVIVPRMPGGFDAAPFTEHTTPSGAKFQRMLWVGESAIRRENLLNAAFWVFRAEPKYLAPGVEAARALVQGLQLVPRLPDARAHLKRALRGGKDIGRFAVHRLGLPSGAGPIVLRALGEQMPDPASRITLNGRRDRFGRRGVNLNWRVSPVDVQHLRRHQELLAAHLERRGMGTIIDRLPTDGSLPLFWSNHHHLGGTRMHADHTHGVVDANCRVHAASNLFVVGSSVFPTGGYVNPTWTIIALAMRTAEVIAREL
jgi:choline dehydrogenase-like flavoprotein